MQHHFGLESVERLLHLQFIVKLELCVGGFAGFGKFSHQFLKILDLSKQILLRAAVLKSPFVPLNLLKLIGQKIQLLIDLVTAPNMLF